MIYSSGAFPVLDSVWQLVIIASYYEQSA
jgi:hypothetical protein